MGRAGVLRSVSPGVATHTAPSLAQVVAVDLDEGLNGLVSYRMQVGMPRMDFLINSSSGVVVTTTELDRERIAEYQLRVVASDAGTPTKSSTSTLTIRGESDGGTSCYMLNTRARAQPGQCQPGWREPYALLLSIIHVGTGCLAHRASSSTGVIQHSRAFPVSTKSKTPATLLPPGRCLQCPRAGGQWPGPPASVSLFDPGNSRESLRSWQQQREGRGPGSPLWGGRRALRPDILFGDVKGTFPSHTESQWKDMTPPWEDGSQDSQTP